MDYSVLEKSTLFSGVPAAELRTVLEETPHHIQCCDKGEILFHLMEPATRIGIILEGRVEAQKSFPNGSQVNVSIRVPGEMIGPAAVFSKNQKYPCDIVSLEPVTVMMFRKDDLIRLMQKDVRVLENFTEEIASAIQRDSLEFWCLGLDISKLVRCIMPDLVMSTTNTVQQCTVEA